MTSGFQALAVQVDDLSGELARKKEEKCEKKIHRRRGKGWTFDG
jgi:hypothetical protein